MRELIYILSGLISGIAAGMGMGGGTILIPALTLLAGVAQRDAQGVNMLAFIPAAALALIIHGKEKRVGFRECVPLVLSGAVGAAGGAYISSLIDTILLKKAFGVFLIVLALIQLRGEKNR